MLELVYKNTILKSIHNRDRLPKFRNKLELVYKNTILKSIHNNNHIINDRQIVGISL